MPEFDPVYGTAQEKYLTGMWSNPRTGRPENETFGLSFTRGGYHRLGYVMPRSSGGYMVYRPAHWVFAGTQLEYGDVFGDRDRSSATSATGSTSSRGTACRTRPAGTAPP